jgi:hypothetical protein
MMRLPLERVCCLDFEASGLGERSYPVEAAVVDCATLQCHCWLIQPSARWMAEGVRSAEAAELHKIAMSELLTHGRAITEVARELEACCRGMHVLCDGGEHDQRWLTTLFAGAGRNVPFLIYDFETFAAELSEKRDSTVAVINSEPVTAHRPIAHRASADARSLAMTLRRIAGWS